MPKFHLQAISAFCLVAAILTAEAEVHDVVVGNNFFSPNDLTIQVGDTVRWTNNSGRMHDVTADDFSWASPTSSSFVFERTFNSAEEILYHCTVHSSPGRPIDIAQNGRLVVMQAEEPTFQINAGLNDAWYNPATPGQGMLISVFPDIEQMFVAWFTFDTERPPEDVEALLGEPGHRWLTAQGPYSGDTANLTIFVTEGGVFDAAEPEATTDGAGDGSLTIEFAGCNEALATYDITSLGLSGEIPLERIVLDNVPLCEADQPAQ
jgi:plastocyanin